MFANLLAFKCKVAPHLLSHLLAATNFGLGSTPDFLLPVLPFLPLFAGRLLLFIQAMLLIKMQNIWSRSVKTCGGKRGQQLE